jgi:hypothetical protein
MPAPSSYSPPRLHVLFFRPHFFWYVAKNGSLGLLLGYELNRIHSKIEQNSLNKNKKGYEKIIPDPSSPCTAICTLLSPPKSQLTSI